jgi:ABC-type glycerol-3-phosphate transport system substrate-binding protein
MHKNAFRGECGVRAIVAAAVIGAALLAGSAASARTTLTIATVNNADMIRMRALSGDFTARNPDIALNWVTLEENVLRQRVTLDIATKGGQFDVVTIGSYEVPIWGKRGWLESLDDLSPALDPGDFLPSIRAALTVSGRLRASPFYAESSITLYRKDLFRNAGLAMPQNPSWDFIARAVQKLDDRGNGIYGICLRGKAGWGENMALVTVMGNSFGARWFDMDWRPQFDRPQWRRTLATYVDLLRRYGPPGASANGFNENLALFGTVRDVDRRVGGCLLRVRSDAIARGRKRRLRAGAECRPRTERGLALDLEPRHSGRDAQRGRGETVHRLGDRPPLSRSRRGQIWMGACAAGDAPLPVSRPAL